MMNIRVDYTLELLNLNKQDIGLMLIEYIEGQGKISLYSDKFESESSNTSPEIIYISTGKLCEILTFLLPFEVAPGTDHISIFNKLNHRKITYLRVFLPQALVQIDYEEDSQNFDFSEGLAEKFRGLLRRV